MSESTRIALLGRDGQPRAYAVVDADDAEWLSQWRWTYQEIVVKGYRYQGYARRTMKIHGKPIAILMHRLIMGVEYSGRSIVIDHINGDTLDNRRSNLRIGTMALNSQNRRVTSGFTSKYRGVYWSDDKQRWIAKAQINRRNHYVGSFFSEEEADQAVRKWRERNMPFAT